MTTSTTGILGKLLLLLVAMAMLTGSVQAQWMKPIEVYLGVGTSSPKDPEEFNRFFKGSYNLSFGVGMQTSSFMEIIGRFEYHRFPSEVDDFEGGLTTIKTLGAEAKLNVTLGHSPIQPYALLGMGLSWMRQAEWEPHLMELFLSGQTDLYYTGGLGVQTQLDGPLGFFAQYKLTGITTSQPNRDFGGSMRFWSLSVGIKLVERL